MTRNEPPIMHMADVAQALDWQAGHCERNGAPATGRVIRAFAALLDGDTQCGRQMREWPGLTLEDAMPLRLAGGLHNLLLTGADDRLAPVYRGEVTDAAAVERIVLAMVAQHDTRLFPWFDGPPQTNEAGRSAGIMALLLWLSGRVGPRFELLELGCSAGINTMLDRFGFDLGGVAVGDAASLLRIAPEWRGPPPPDMPVAIASVNGCDLAPIDLTDPVQALRLKSYVWPDMPERLARIDAAIALASVHRPGIRQQDAADFVQALLAERQERGTCRVLFHSIVWQYLPPETRARIETMMAEAGATATPDRPLAWIKVETNRETFRHELRALYWPGGEGEVVLGEAHAHGAWVEWFGR